MISWLPTLRRPEADRDLLKGIKGDYDVAKVTEREVFLTFYRKPDGTYVGGSQLAIEKDLPKGVLMTMRNWNTILKAIA